MGTRDCCFFRPGVDFPRLSSDFGPKPLCSDSLGQSLSSNKWHCNRSRASYMYRQKKPVTISSTHLSSNELSSSRLPFSVRNSRNYKKLSSLTSQPCSQ